MSTLLANVRGSPSYAVDLDRRDGPGDAPAASWADADPASDVLLSQDSYVPYEPMFPKPLGAGLRATIARAKQAGYPLKVAVVGSGADLGAIPNMFNKPVSYAPFLARELSPSTVPVLVVMPAGLAAANVTPAARKALDTVHVDNEFDGLARAAIQAIPKMATASGHPIPATKLPAGTGKSGGGGTSPLIVFGAPVALVALAALVIGLRRRHEERDNEPHASDPPSGEEPGS